MRLFDILKSRWPEVLMIVVFQAGLLVLMQDVAKTSNAAPIPDGKGFFLGFGMMLFGIVSQVLFLGFLRTAAYSGVNPVNPMALLQEGSPFFWRIFFVQLLIFLVYIAIVVVLSNLTAALFFPEGKMETLPDWLMNICSFVSFAALLKPVLFFTANIVVADCGIVQAFVRTRGLRLLQEAFFMRLIGILLGGYVCIAVLCELAQNSKILYYPASGIESFSMAIVMLILSLAAALKVKAIQDAEAMEKQTQDEENK